MARWYHSNRAGRLQCGELRQPSHRRPSPRQPRLLPTNGSGGVHVDTKIVHCAAGCRMTGGNALWAWWDCDHTLHVWTLQALQLSPNRCGEWPSPRAVTSDDCRPCWNTGTGSHACVEGTIRIHGGESGLGGTEARWDRESGVGRDAGGPTVMAVGIVGTSEFDLRQTSGPPNSGWLPCKRDRPTRPLSTVEPGAIDPQLGARHRGQQ